MYMINGKVFNQIRFLENSKNCCNNVKSKNSRNIKINECKTDKRYRMSKNQYYHAN